METPQFLKKLLGLRDPRRAATLVARGVAEAREGDTRGALKRYQDAIKADDTYALAHLNVALALQDLFNDERASLDPEEHASRLLTMATHLRTALELDERLHPALRALGYVERLQGNFAQSQDAFTQYLAAVDAKDPQRDRVTLALAEVTEKATTAAHILAGTNVAEKVSQHDETARLAAEERLRAALEKEPARAEAWWALGVLRRAAGDLVTAKEVLEKALGVDPDCMPAHKELAGLYFHQGDAVKALPHARAAYESDPTNPALVCNLGVCHLALGQMEDAREFIQIARGLAPKDPIVVEAFKALEDALKSAPKR